MRLRTFETLLTSFPSPSVLLVELNRPKNANAMNSCVWTELRECFAVASASSEVRAIVVAGAGKNFSAGLDLRDNPLMTLMKEKAWSQWDSARKSLHMRRLIMDMQESFSCMERCPQPVVAAVHGACVGAGIDLITAADVRIAAACSKFSVMEVKLGLCADVGTLQRLPKVVGSSSWIREVCMTGRMFDAEEALRVGLVSHLVAPGGKENVISEAVKLATEMASLSPLAVSGTKMALNYARDHPVPQALEHVATWNAAALHTDDLSIAQGGATSRAPGSRTPSIYSNL